MVQIASSFISNFVIFLMIWKRMRRMAGPEQKAVAEEVIASMNAAKLWNDPIVTEVTPASTFYAAEDYHQEYFARNPGQPYCMFVVAPKVIKFRKEFLSKRKKSG